MKSEALPQHAWLRRLVGEWTFSGADEHSGTETVRAIGDLWVEAAGVMEHPGGTAESRMTLGYDPLQSRFVGTFIASPMSYLWVYNGTLDESETTLTLETEGPDFKEAGKMGRYRDFLILEGQDRRIFRSSYLRDDGEWETFMNMEYQRVAAATALQG